MSANTLLAGIFGPLVGTGPGAGMALIIFFCGLAVAIAGAAGYLFRAVRNAEDILPDHDAGPKAGAVLHEPGELAEPAPEPVS